MFFWNNPIRPVEPAGAISPAWARSLCCRRLGHVAIRLAPRVWRLPGCGFRVRVGDGPPVDCVNATIASCIRRPRNATKPEAQTTALGLDSLAGGSSGRLPVACRRHGARRASRWPLLGPAPHRPGSTIQASLPKGTKEDDRLLHAICPASRLALCPLAWSAQNTLHGFAAKTSTAPAGLRPQHA